MLADIDIGRHQTQTPATRGNIFLYQLLLSSILLVNLSYSSALLITLPKTGII